MSTDRASHALKHKYLSRNVRCLPLNATDGTIGACTQTLRKKKRGRWLVYGDGYDGDRLEGAVNSGRGR